MKKTQLPRVNIFLKSVAFLMFCLSGTYSLAQDDLGLKEFREQHSGKKILLYEGQLDTYHPFQLALTFDGKDCSGYYKYESSDTQFTLEGDIEDDSTLTIIELDANDQVSGYIMGKFSVENMELIWQDIKKLTSHQFALTRVESFKAEQYVSQEKSLVKIVAKSYGKRIDLWQDVLEKKINIVGENFPFFSFDYRCNDDCTKVESKALRKESDYRTFQMVPFSDEKETITFFKKDGTKYLFVGEKEQTIYQKHKTFADYRVMIDLSYPVTRSFKFNQWIESNINQVQKKLLQEINKNILDDEGDLPEERFQFEAYSWYDIDYISADIISGTITHTKSWKSDTEKIAFIFDNKEQQMLELQDLFKSKFDYRTFMVDYVKEQKKNMSGGAPDGPRLSWINGDKFDNVSISEMGLICNSNYSVIFGDNKFVIPFEYIKKHVKNKSIKNEFIN